MNDGSAFPFVMLGLGLLGLHDLDLNGSTGLGWLLRDVLWATVASVAIGVVAGVVLARLVWRLRRAPHQHELMDDFLGLGLIGLVYGLTVAVSAYGFLAVFFAAVALRQTELKLASKVLPTEVLAKVVTPEPLPLPTVSEGSLVFKEHLERLSELMLILMVGGSLFLSSWSWQGTLFALFLFVVARPISALLGLLGTGTPWRIRGMTAWFGVRGIGSLYYLMFAIQHGLPEPLALQLMNMTLMVVTLSILIHGVSVKPLMGVFWRTGKNGAKD